MNNREINRQYQFINSLIENTEVFTHGDIELQGHWGKYLCVLVAGFLENAISEVYIAFVSDCSSHHISKFATNTLKKIRNPKSSRFVETAYAFKKEWGDELTIFFEVDNSRGEAINSIMTNRHLIAHGKSTSISVRRVKEYFEKSIETISFIESQTSNSNPSS